MEVKKQRSPHARTLHTDPADPSVPENWQTDAATWTTSFSNPIWFGVNYSSKYSTAPFLIPRRTCCSALYEHDDREPIWCQHNGGWKAAGLVYQSASEKRSRGSTSERDWSFFLMTATTNSILLKPHSPPCEELACLRVHLYLNTPDKNELPVVVNWICRSTASSPQNVLCHKWIKLSLCDVKIFNTASGLLGFREIPHCWCILVLSSEGEKGSFFSFFFLSLVLPLGMFVCLNLWPLVPSSKVQTLHHPWHSITLCAKWMTVSFNCLSHWNCNYTDNQDSSTSLKKCVVVTLLPDLQRCY